MLLKLQELDSAKRDRKARGRGEGGENKGDLTRNCMTATKTLETEVLMMSRAVFITQNQFEVSPVQCWWCLLGIFIMTSSPGSIRGASQTQPGQLNVCDEGFVMNY